jgi:hypothetical protein
LAEVNPINQAVSSEHPIQILEEEAAEVSSVIPTHHKEAPCLAHNKLNPSEPLEVVSLEETPQISRHLSLVEDSLEPLNPNNRLEGHFLVAISSKPLEVSLEAQPHSRKVEDSLEDSNSNNLNSELQNQQEDCLEPPPLNHNNKEVDCLEHKQHQPKEVVDSLVSRLSQSKQDFLDSSNPNKQEAVFSAEASPNKQEECSDNNHNNKLLADCLVSHSSSNNKPAVCSAASNKQDHPCLVDNSKLNPKAEEDCLDKHHSKLVVFLEDNSKRQEECLGELRLSKEQVEVFSDSNQPKTQADCLEGKPNKQHQHGANLNSNNNPQLHHGVDSPHSLAVDNQHNHKPINLVEQAGESTPLHSAKPNPTQWPHSNPPSVLSNPKTLKLTANISSNVSLLLTSTPECPKNKSGAISY